MWNHKRTNRAGGGSVVFQLFRVPACAAFLLPDWSSIGSRSEDLLNTSFVLSSGLPFSRYLISIVLNSEVLKSPDLGTKWELACSNKAWDNNNKFQNA